MEYMLPKIGRSALLEMDEETFAMILREEDFLDVKLGSKPDCDPIRFRSLSDEEKARTRELAGDSEYQEKGKYRRLPLID